MNSALEGEYAPSPSDTTLGVPDKSLPDVLLSQTIILLLSPLSDRPPVHNLALIRANFSLFFA